MNNNVTYELESHATTFITDKVSALINVRS